MEKTPSNKSKLEKFSSLIIGLLYKNLYAQTKKAILGIDAIKFVTGNGAPS